MEFYITLEFTVHTHLHIFLFFYFFYFLMEEDARYGLNLSHLINDIVYTFVSQMALLLILHKYFYLFIY